MKEYDVIVIGSGCGMGIVDRAVSNGLSVALVERGPVGGTCPNTGCIPSKMLIYPADVVMEIQRAEKLGIHAGIQSIDFNAIMKRMRKSVTESRRDQRQGLLESGEIDFYEGQGKFVKDYTIEVKGEELKGEKIFIATGSRPMIPPIKGLDTVDYLTNESVLQLENKPSSLLIIGGGYIAVEYGHFFAAMGTEVTIIEMAERLAMAEEPEISELLRRELSKRLRINLNCLAQEVSEDKDGVRIRAKDTATEQEREFSAEALLVAVGRRPNSDTLKLENTGVEINEKGYVKVDDYLMTTKENIWAVGDINGQMMFTHVGNAEAELAARNGLDGENIKVDYRAAPHAVYSYPQIASVGMTEEQAGRDHRIVIGQSMYSSTAKGEAMMEEEGFAKAIVDEDTLEILGFHIIGPHAPILIQEVVNAMTSGNHLDDLINGIHIHPALSELIQTTISLLEEPVEGQEHHHD
ncbi:MAG: dihydrolipoyl dehydrogenase [Dehalococcoidia bacterium]